MQGRHINEVLVCCGSRPGKNPLYAEHAKRLGTLLGINKHPVIYGGGVRGLMGDVAKAAKCHGSEITAIFAAAFAEAVKGEDEPTTTMSLETLSARKDHMILKADVAIILPGGAGTFGEIGTLVDDNDYMRHLNPNNPFIPIIYVNTAGHFDHLALYFNRQVEDGFVYPETYDNMRYFVDTPEQAIQLLELLNSKAPRLAQEMTPLAHRHS